MGGIGAEEASELAPSVWVGVRAGSGLAVALGLALGEGW